MPICFSGETRSQMKISLESNWSLPTSWSPSKNIDTSLETNPSLLHWHASGQADGHHRCCISSRGFGALGHEVQNHHHPHCERPGFGSCWLLPAESYQELAVFHTVRRLEFPHKYVPRGIQPTENSRCHFPDLNRVTWLEHLPRNNRHNHLVKLHTISTSTQQKQSW